MKWLLDRLRRRKRPRRETDEERAAMEAAPPDSTQHRLILLVHDASAPASYQLQTFEDAASAAEFVQFWYPPTTEHGVLAFWALHRKPVRWPGSSEERPAEVVILVRDKARRETVYPYSMPNMEAARSWVMNEAATGLDLRLVLMYWAVPAKICRNRWGHVRITPAAPPSAHRPALLRSSTVIVSKDESRRGEADSAPEPGHELRHSPKGADDAAEGDPTKRPAEAKERLTSAEIAEKMISEVLGKSDRPTRRGRGRWEQQDGPFRGFGSPRGRF